MYSVVADLAAADEQPSLAGAEFGVRLRARIDHPEGHVSAVRFVDAHTVLAASSTGHLGTVDLRGTRLARLATLSAGVVAMDVLAGQAVLGLRDGTVAVCDVAAAARAQRHRLPAGATPTACRWLGPGLFAVATDTGRVLLFDAATATPVQEARLGPAARPDAARPCRVTALDADPGTDGLLLTGDGAGGVLLWDRRSLDAPWLGTREPPRQTITGVCLHRSRPGRVVSAAADGSILEHAYDAQAQDGLVETWAMPPPVAPPARVNCLDMVGSLAVAGLDNADILAWRM